jgi:hypothetical protein
MTIANRHHFRPRLRDRHTDPDELRGRFTFYCDSIPVNREVA